jgi:hypothetical protein
MKKFICGAYYFSLIEKDLVIEIGTNEPDFDFSMFFLSQLETIDSICLLFII